MPIFTEQTVDREVSNGVCGHAEILKLSDSGGLTQFGAMIEVLAPGARSSICHWHAREDELIHVLAGEATVVEGGMVHSLRPGDTATFRAGAAQGHYVENRTQADIRYLIVGTRSDTDVVTYPDDDRVLIRTPEGSRWTDHAGAPASNPYGG